MDDAAATKGKAAATKGTAAATRGTAAAAKGKATAAMADEGRQIRCVKQGATSVSVAGPWNDWCGSATGGLNPAIGAMRSCGNGVFVYDLDGRIPPGRYEYKFVVDGHWEGGGNRSLTISHDGRVVDPHGLVQSVTIAEVDELQVTFSVAVDSALVSFSVSPPIAIRKTSWARDGHAVAIALAGRIPLDQAVEVTVAGLRGGAITRLALPGAELDRQFGTAEPLGIFRESATSWRFRVFAPRARSVTLALYEPQSLQAIAAAAANGSAAALPPYSRHDLRREPGGSWTCRIDEDLLGWGALYFVDGPGPDFDASRPIVDPYAIAAIYHRGPAIIREPIPFASTSPAADCSFTIPAKEDLVICEVHLRDLTAHESAGVKDLDTVGRFAALEHSMPLAHLKSMGYNCLEFLPLFEFDDDPPGSYHWGYMTSLFFAPDAAYASSPLGSAVEECRQLIRHCHERGLAVILDVVYNHTGAPHHFVGLDRSYYYRRDAFGNYQNLSGCGNDFRSEAPMARRLILDSVRYWLAHMDVDGFRFDLAQLIDLETLDEVAQVAEATKPGAILIAEPWSFGGSNKEELGRHPRWSCWNDDFRNRVKAYAMGQLADRHELAEVFSGSTALWAALPTSSVNYVESHDDHTLVDHLSHRKDWDGSHPTVREIRMNRMCTLLLLTAPGIPMLAQGQELLRSKKGCGNSYNRGDALNAIDWSRRSACSSHISYIKDLVTLRKSDDGRPFRRTSPLPGNCCKELLPDETDGPCPKAIGLRIPGPPHYLLLLNSHQRKSVRFALPRGRWRQVADLQHVSTTAATSGALHKKEMVLTPLDGRLLRLADE